MGAYFLILMAMWTRESCDLPDDDARLARVARVSPTLWKRRIGPVIRSFLTVDNGTVFQKRLRKEATFVEHGVGLQSNRKKGKSDDKPLKSNEPYETTDITTELPVDNPTQQPNNPTLSIGGGSSAGAENPPVEMDHQTDRELILDAMGLDPTGCVGGTKFIGGQGDMAEVRRWLELPGLTIGVICAEIRHIVAAKSDGRPSSFRYFTAALQRLSAEISQPALTPTARSQRWNTPSTPLPRKTYDLNLDQFDDFGKRIS